MVKKIAKRLVLLIALLLLFGMLHRFTENVCRRCILDGELAVIADGKPDFFAIQRRSLMTNPIKIQLASRRQPACFVAFDLLYLDDHPTTDLPLMERKKLPLTTALYSRAMNFADRCEDAS